MKDPIQIRAVSAPWHAGVDLLVRHGDGVGVHVTVEVPPAGTAIEPTMTIPPSAAQTLMDDLWVAGFRPTEGSGSAGSLRATERHLDDLRKIAFKKLGINEAGR